MENKKITLKEFWDSEVKLSIHCKTKDQAKKLCNEFHKLGKTWNSGKSYLVDNFWNAYKEDTCYTNEGKYAHRFSLNFYLFKIYEFEDIIF